MCPLAASEKQIEHDRSYVTYLNLYSQAPM